MEVAVWAPCKVELAAQRKKPKWAYVTVADVTGELKEDMDVALFFRQQDGSVVVATGEVARVMKDGAVRIRIPWFVGASLAAWAGINIAEAGGKIELYNCAVQIEILEEAEEEGRGRGLRIKHIAEEE
jgi:ribosomal protein L15